MILNSCPDIMRIEEVQGILRINKGACYNLLRTGKLRGFKVGNKTWLVPRPSLEQYIARNTSFCSGKAV